MGDSSLPHHHYNHSLSSNGPGTGEPLLSDDHRAIGNSSGINGDQPSPQSTSSDVATRIMKINLLQVVIPLLSLCCMQTTECCRVFDDD
jgi:hypothetical protein